MSEKWQHDAGTGSRPLNVVSFGEILFDLIDGEACLGGAPLNLAVHLRRLGAEVRMISALGRDELGEQARREVAGHGLAVDVIAAVEQPTGTVTVTLDDSKKPVYRFLADCAYDHIPDRNYDFSGLGLFCYGTLAQRHECSRRTLRRLLEQVDAPRFYDVNLRQDFFSRPILEESLTAADMVKLNEDELPVIAGLFGIPAECEALAVRFGLQTVIHTLGPEGCRVWHNGRVVTSPAWPARVVSTVGAGDAFSAAFLNGFFRTGKIEQAAEAGNRLAAEVVGRKGAL